MSRWWKRKKHHPVSMFLRLHTIGTEEFLMTVQTTLVEGQEQLAHDIVKNHLGNVDVTTPVVWSVDDATVCSVSTGDPLGRSATIVALKAGSANVSAVCGPATTVVQVTVTAALPTEVDVTLDPPTDVPPAAPAA
jgi:hypothetical protein